MTGRRRRIEVEDVTRWAALTAGGVGLGLVGYGALPGVDLPEPWFRGAVLVLLSSVLVEVQGERRTLTRVIEGQEQSDRAAGPFESRERSYQQAAHLISATSPETEGDKVIQLTSLHGHAHAQHLTDGEFERPDPAAPALVAFRSAIEDRLRQGWQLHQVVSFSTETRLDAFLERLASFPPASRVQVRAFDEHDGIPSISTLVVARRSAMLAADDDQIFGVGSAVRLEGIALARWAEHQFTQLWEVAPYTIWRPGSGVDATAVEALRAAIRATPTTAAQVVVDREGPTSYERATAAILAELERPGEIRIDLANLHGLGSGARPVRSDLVQSWILEFEGALDRCFIDHPERSRARLLYNVDSVERFEAMVARLERWERADGLEIRAFVLGDAIATISPLIVGEEQLFLGSEGDRLNRTTRSMAVSGERAAEWGREYFELVWRDPRAIPLRTAFGIDEAGLARLRERLDEATGKRASTDATGSERVDPSIDPPQ